MSDKFDEIKDMEELAEIQDDDIQDEADKTETQEGSATETEIQDADDSAADNESESDTESDSQTTIPDELALGSDSTAPTKLSSSLTVQESFNEAKLNDGNGGTPESAVEINVNYKPETEDALIELGKRLKAQEYHSVLKSRWFFGRAINRSDETVYGDNTAGRIAEEVGYSKSTIHKCKQFGGKYNSDQLASLLNGPFPLSWRDVTQNLSVSQEDFLRTYHESVDLEQFRNAVTELRRTRPTRNPSTRPPRKTWVELETENTELRNRVSDLAAENTKLQARIQELEGQHETSEAIPDSVEESELAEELSN